MKKQTEKQADALKALNLFNKTNELKQIEVIFPKNLLNYLIFYKLREIVQLQDIIKSNDMDYTSKCGKRIVAVNIHYLLFSKKYIQTNVIIRRM